MLPLSPAESPLGPLLPPLPPSLASGTFGLWLGKNNTGVNQQGGQ